MVPVYIVLHKLVRSLLAVSKSMAAKSFILFLKLYKNHHFGNKYLFAQKYDYGIGN